MLIPNACNELHLIQRCSFNTKTNKRLRISFSVVAFSVAIPFSDIFSLTRPDCVIFICQIWSSEEQKSSFDAKEHLSLLQSFHLKSVYSKTISLYRRVTQCHWYNRFCVAGSALILNRFTLHLHNLIEKSGYLIWCNVIKIFYSKQTELVRTTLWPEITSVVNDNDNSLIHRSRFYFQIMSSPHKLGFMSEATSWIASLAERRVAELYVWSGNGYSVTHVSPQCQRLLVWYWAATFLWNGIFSHQGRSSFHSSFVPRP